LVEPNRQLLYYYYYLYILYTALIANYYYFLYDYFNYTYYWLCRCPATLFTFLPVGPKGPYLLFYYTTYFLLFTFSYVFIINFKYTHTTHILALTSFARRPCPTPVECYIHYTQFTQVDRCVRAITRSS
jgi:hypothetical protein